MKVLVATRTSQGLRDPDRWLGCIGGEPVRPIEERCSMEPDATCSCEVAFVGIGSRGLTTTATVQERPGLTMSDYAGALGTSLTEREAGRIVVERYAEELVRVAAGVEPGEVLERWDDWIQHRFDRDSGEPVPDVVRLMDVDPEVLDEIDFEAETAALLDDPDAA